MSSTLLQALARRADALITDAELLTRFASNRDEAAFAELVRRHGPLVWTVCRHLLPDHADAEDAFQAVFLALARSAGRVRDGRAVPSWLHGAAVRVCLRARRAFARRKARERRAATPEADRPVSEETWAALMRAVHEEVQKLPDGERAAFVLCELEGVPQPDAAARLGWPLGSLSGRLCKARQRLMDRLTARGLAPAVALGVGVIGGAAGAVPAGLAEAAKALASAPGAASAGVRELACILTGESAMRMKLLAAATVLVAAVGLTGGAVVLSKADAQPPGGGGSEKGPPPGAGSGTPSSPGPGVGDPAGGGRGGPPGSIGGGASGAGAPGGSGPGVGGPGPLGHGGLPPGAPGGPPGGFGGPGMGFGPGGPGMAAPAVEHLLVDVKNDRKAFQEAVVKHGKEGWEFCGSERFGQNELTLVFKKAKGTVMIGGAGFGPPGGGGGPFGGGRGSGGAAGGAAGGGGRAGGGDGIEIELNVPGPGGAGLPFLQVMPKAGLSDQLAAELRKAIPRGMQVDVDKGTGMLKVTGSPKVLEEAKKLIEQFGEKAGRPAPKGDGPRGVGPGALVGLPAGAQDAQLYLIPLRHADAGEMVSTLGRLFRNIESLTTDPRTNQLIVRCDPKTLAEIRELVQQLDVDVPKRK